MKLMSDNSNLPRLNPTVNDNIATKHTVDSPVHIVKTGTTVCLECGKDTRPAPTNVTDEALDEILTDCTVALTSYTDADGNTITDMDTVVLNTFKAKAAIQALYAGKTSLNRGHGTILQPTLKNPSPSKGLAELRRKLDGEPVNTDKGGDEQ